jgi:hypothetical protein
MKKLFILGAVICLIAAGILFAQKTIRVPKNIPDGDIVYYVQSGDAYYHLKDCPDISGKSVACGTIIAENGRGLAPCPKCLFKDQVVSPEPKLAGAAEITNMHKVAEWQGASIKNTETFEVASKEWKIFWATRGDSNFSITVYDANTDKMVDLVANIIGSGSDTSVIRGKGRFYLKILASQDYKIQIYDQR